MEGQPPPPPPHGANSHGGRSGGLPDGKYDIFVVPPSSAGSGFLYLPSLQTQRNSFVAGVACTAVVFFIWNITVPVVKDWFYETMYGGGSGVFILIVGVAVLGWAFGKTQAESAGAPGSGTGASGAFNSGGGAQTGGTTGTGPQSPPGSSWQRPPPQANTKAGTTGAKTSWEKAREETRKKEEEKRKADELKKRKEELEKERQKQREKDVRERLERERKERKEREDKEAAKSSPKRPPMPTARTEDEDDAYSFRPYDRPRRPYKANSAASMYSESSYAASQTTARTTPPPKPATGPYSTKDPDKIIIRGVYAFTNAFMKTPTQQLVSGTGQVTDGLILRITTEGLFIDDDRRGVPQREWDVKAWTMKLAESCEMAGLHVLRASIRDQDGKKYVFILSQSEGWKVAVGLQRLRRGSQVRALGVAGMPMNEAKALLESLGYV